MSKKTTVAFAALAALSLSACTPMPPCHDDMGVQAPDPMKPKISIVDGQYLVVNQEPLVFTPRQRDVQIVWHLPAAMGYRFTEEGISFQDKRDEKRSRMTLNGTTDEEIVKCERREEGLTFTCLNRHTKPGTYKYTITIESKDGRKLTLDPTIVNY
jgi:hypothetical protein